MTSASEQQPPAPTPAANRPVWLAAILGGVLGALFSFALTRSFPPPVKPVPPPSPSEAREFADDLFRRLKTGKTDEFKKLVRPAFARMSDEQFDKFCQQEVFGQRDSFAQMHGAPVEFEFARETVLSPSLVRVTYTEKYARGCMLWVVVVYNTPEGWQVSAFSFDTSVTGFRALQ